jgi:hypothetical protein
MLIKLAVAFSAALAAGTPISVPSQFRTLGVASGADAVWTTDGSTTLSRVDPAAQSIVASIPIPDANIVVAAGGSIWVIGSNSKATRVDPSTNKVISSVPVARDPTGVGIGLGSLWVAGRNSQTLTRVSLATGKVIARLKTPDTARYVAVVGGALWIAANDTPTIWELSAAGKLLRSIDLSDTINGMAATGRVLWLLGSTNNRLVKIDTGRRKIAGYIAIPKSDGFFGYGGAIARDGTSLWVATLTHVLRVDGASGKIVGAVAVGSHPAHDPAGLSSIAVGPAGVWVGDADGKAIVPLTP